MNKKQTTLLVLLLLIAAATIFFFLCNKKEKPGVSPPASSLQGSTEIGSGDIKITIWDNEAEDGDTVQVFFDNKLVKDSIAILNSPVELQIGHLKKGAHQLVVSAISEGMNAPATASIGLSNGKETENFVMDATKDSAAAWHIIIK